jgi:CheY-like chemotaxis protein
MLTSDAIAQELPRLRRYARVLTGSQASGDAYVSVALEALVQDPSALYAGPAIGLFQTFTRIWNSADIGQSADCGEGLAGRHLARVAPMPRQAFLLSSLEDFSDEQAAFILGVDVPAFRRLVDRFGRELAREIATDVLIIEDEPFIALTLEELVERLGHRVIGLARTHGEALDLASAEPPGLILADVRLQDESSGLDAVNDLAGQADVPAVFITAYPERLLTAEQPEPVFLIPKPFRTTHVAAVVTQALFFDRQAKTEGLPP